MLSWLGGGGELTLLHLILNCIHVHRRGVGLALAPEVRHGIQATAACSSLRSDRSSHSLLQVVVLFLLQHGEMLLRKHGLVSVRVSGGLLDSVAGDEGSELVSKHGSELSDFLGLLPHVLDIFHLFKLLLSFVFLNVHTNFKCLLKLILSLHGVSSLLLVEVLHALGLLNQRSLGAKELVRCFSMIVLI